MQGSGYAPIERVSFPAFEAARVDLWIKRDDLLHPFVSGNKLRKLEPIISLAKDKGFSKLVSIGGAYSNHLLALACLGAQEGIETRGLVRGDTVHNHVLQLCKLYGMELEFVSREEFSSLRMITRLDFEKEQVFIPEGANCPEGVAGAAQFWKELGSRHFDHVVDAVGSGCAAKGALDLLPDEVTFDAVMCVRDEGLAEDLANRGAKVHQEFTRGGFGKMDEELVSACQLFSKQTGVLLDPVYTGKLWMAMLDLLNQGYFSQSSRVLLVHSGGLTGWLSERALKFVSL